MDKKKIYTYLFTDGKYYKIGRSKDPKKRLYAFKTGNINCELVCFGLGVSERELHKTYSDKRVNGEWFALDTNDVMVISSKIQSSEIIGVNDYSNSVEEDYRKFIESYKSKKWHKSYSLHNSDLYTYSSNKGKFGMSNLLLDLLVNDYTPIGCRLFLSIVNKLEQSYDFEKSAVVYLKYPLFKDTCSVNVFSLNLKKFISDKLLIETPKKKYYIVNPMYINKFFKEKIDKKNE